MPFEHPDGPTDDGDYPFTSHYYEDRLPQVSNTPKSLPPSLGTPRLAPLPYDDDVGTPGDQPGSGAPFMGALPSSSSSGGGYFHGRGHSNGSNYSQDGTRSRGSRERGQRGQRGSRGTPRGRGRGRQSFSGPPGHSPTAPYAEYTPNSSDMQMQEYDPHQMHDVSQPFTSPFYGTLSPASPSGHINPNFVAAAMASMGMDSPMGMSEMSWPQSPMGPFQQPYVGPNHPGFFAPDGMYYPQPGTQPPGENYWPWQGQGM